MPKLKSPRFVLRPPEYSDSSRLAELMNDYDVVKNLMRAPYPYSEEDARNFVSMVALQRANGESFVFTILRASDEEVLGTCGINLEDGVFDLGYWIGKPFWGQGVATEAAERTIQFAFNSLKADKLTAGWFADNPASGHVLEKLGFVRCGTQPYPSKARGAMVSCHRMLLSREAFGQMKAA